ncbi:TetR/AcrR family transcriptional regulator [Pseudochelatococcus contaminans]|uniref:AcrR family transcriptional regulator n=1 Tax=Pseudochelatococcus contaminans TaxID=1538103 RepID=A0A7W5Z4W7_9HYPH|nr:TetR/AcrR family transcriptional regulator [Pseudochelatococcus contaminans]MBB3810220.1 AcrR family transcriptional regulator [Pseudochelatococcus contaminans]
MSVKKVVRGEGETRQRILKAAIEHFEKASYDDVGLRDIAADVGVDVAYVHRSFGSKEGLFREVLLTAGKAESVSELTVDELPAAFARQLFQREHDADGDIEPLLILVRSLTSRKAGGLVSERLSAELIDPLQAKFGDSDPFRAATIISLLIGLSVMRNLLKLPSVSEADVISSEKLVARAIEGIINSTDTSQAHESGKNVLA